MVLVEFYAISVLHIALDLYNLSLNGILGLLINKTIHYKLDLVPIAYINDSNNILVPITRSNRLQ